VKHLQGEVGVAGQPARTPGPGDKLEEIVGVVLKRFYFILG
jgi:hypothetical protein